MRGSWCLVALLVLSPAARGEEKQKQDARGAVEGYVAAALAGKVETATALAVAGKSPAKKKRIEELPGLLGVKSLKISRVLASDNKGQAIAVSEKVKLTKANPDGSDTGVLTFGLVNVKGKWLVNDIDFGTRDKANEKVKAFQKKHRDAKEIKARAKE